MRPLVQELLAPVAMVTVTVSLCDPIEPSYSFILFYLLITSDYSSLHISISNHPNEYCRLFEYTISASFLSNFKRNFTKESFYNRSDFLFD